MGLGSCVGAGRGPRTTYNKQQHKEESCSFCCCCLLLCCYNCCSFPTVFRPTCFHLCGCRNVSYICSLLSRMALITHSLVHRGRGVSLGCRRRGVVMLLSFFFFFFFFLSSSSCGSACFSAFFFPLLAVRWLNKK